MKAKIVNPNQMFIIPIAMTLIISLISKKIVAHVSDTRLTSFNTKTNKIEGYEDGKVKSIVILGDGGCFLISYCGRGEIDDVRTDLWLTNKLADFGAGKKKIGETIKHLMDLLKQKSSLSNGYHKISIAISGYAINGKTAGICHYLISNFERLKGKKLVSGNIGEFEVFFPKLSRQAPRRPYMILVSGAEKATENKPFDHRMKKVIKLLKSWQPSKNETFKLSLIQLINIAANDSLFGVAISKSCIVTTIPAESWQPESTFFNDSKVPSNIAPHVIGSNITFAGITFSNSQDIKLYNY